MFELVTWPWFSTFELALLDRGYTLRLNMHIIHRWQPWENSDVATTEEITTMLGEHTQN